MASSLVLILGLVLLIGGGALLVRGASDVAASAGVSPMIVGLTVVGFGTSAPELVVNVVGALNGASDLAFGNVVGSNISNLALVLGAAALIAPMTIEGQLVRREVPLLLLVTTVLTATALDSVLDGRISTISRTDSVTLLLLFLIFLYINVLDLYRNDAPDPLLAELADYPLVRSDPASRFRWLMIGAGVATLFIGGQLTVNSAVTLAGTLGVSTTIIGLFVVAIGTSMPELVTSIIAALKNEPDLALGNVVGSNLFNSLIVLPVSGLITPVALPRGGFLDLGLSWVLVALLIPIFIFGEAKLSRTMGGILFVTYSAYLIFRVTSFGP